jgi:hypothetical protein
MRRYLAVCARLEAIAGQDVGKRGVGALLIPGDLANAGLAFARASSVVILTGFPCLLSQTPPTETDGPSGAVALALAAVRLGKPAAIATDACSEGVLRATAAAVGLGEEGKEASGGPVSGSGSPPAARAPPFELHAFPPPPEWSEAVHGARLLDLAARYEHSVAIERAGRGADGGYHTMRDRRMDHLVAPLDELLTIGTRAGGAGPSLLSSSSAAGASVDAVGPLPLRTSWSRSSTGIGDGGNECGMGKVRERVEAHIPTGRSIACVVPADNLVAAGVSNWGGWAVVAAAEAAIRCGLGGGGDGAGGGGRVARPPPSALALALAGNRVRPGILLPTPDEERALVRAMNDAGAGDGITGSRGGEVDGLPLEVHLAVLERLRGGEGLGEEWGEEDDVGA